MLEMIFALIVVSFAIWAMIDVAQGQMKTRQKAIWFAIVVLIPLLGPILYYFKRSNLTINQQSHESD